jgi:demethylmenaquinone methyltransferase/2-methoxy-6-polyprenyl-1,4-benzoquinol methylase
MLDLCCGTGDLAIDVARLAGDNLAVIGVDYSQPMLEIAARKAKYRDTMRISFVNGNAAHLSFPDGYFDCIGISFAFRNLTYNNPLTGKCLDEALRVLKTGGRFVIVETSQPESKLISKIYHLYLGWFVSRLGFILSGNKGAYSYLAESATRFYNSEEVRELLTSAGFRQVSFKPLFLGVAGIHIAIK